MKTVSSKASSASVATNGMRESIRQSAELAMSRVSRMEVRKSDDESVSMVITNRA